MRSARPRILDAYSGVDVFAGSGGRWEVVWSTNADEVGQKGFWASVTVAQTAVCKGGGVVFASDGDVKAIEQAWYWLTGRHKD